MMTKLVNRSQIFPQLKAELTGDEGVDLLDEFLLLLGLEVVIPLGQPGLAGSVLDQDELDRHFHFKFNRLKRPQEPVRVSSRSRLFNRYFPGMKERLGADQAAIVLKSPDRKGGRNWRSLGCLETNLSMRNSDQK